jgi:hypothetical protein
MNRLLIYLFIPVAVSAVLRGIAFIRCNGDCSEGWSCAMIDGNSKCSSIERDMYTREDCVIGTKEITEFLLMIFWYSVFGSCAIALCIKLVIIRLSSNKNNGRT